MFRSRDRGSIRDLTILSGGRELSPDQTITPTRVDAIVGCEWPTEETAVSFRFEAGPLRHAKLPLCAPLAFALICQICHLTLTQVALFAGPRELSDMSRRLSEFSDVLKEPLLVKSPLISGLFVGIPKMKNVPLSSRIFDLKTTHGKYMKVNTSRIILLISGRILLDRMYLSEYGFCDGIAAKSIDMPGLLGGNLRRPPIL
jgi:hypothetical protein